MIVDSSSSKPVIRQGEMIPVITVDGPSGVGKGTISRWLAQKLGWHRLDSGVLYRIAAIASLDTGIAPEDATEISRLCRHLDFRFDEDVEPIRIWLGGKEIGDRIRLESTGVRASVLSAHAVVRSELLKRQRQCRRLPGLVADGRDMGTVVFPDACLKIFLDATADVRANRRWSQLRQAGVNVRLSVLRAEVTERDARDRHRKVSPLRPADDAVVIDTSEMSIDAVKRRIDALLTERGIPAVAT